MHCGKRNLRLPISASRLARRVGLIGCARDWSVRWPSPSGRAAVTCGIRRSWVSEKTRQQTWSSATSPQIRPKRATAAAKNGKARRAKKELQFIANGQDGDGTLAGVRLTSPEKLFFPDDGITKLELAQYYLSVARWILPHVANRPLSLVRCPEGTSEKCFFQKHPGAGTPETIRRVPVKEKDKTRDYLVVDKVEDLIALAQIGALEIHVWGSQADKLEFPDRMIFDLDPDPAVPWPRVVESAPPDQELPGGTRARKAS